MQAIFEYLNPKSYYKKFEANIIKKLRVHLLKEGFMNHYVRHIHGPKNRLKISGKPSLVNTIFNTRSGDIYRA